MRIEANRLTVEADESGRLVDVSARSRPGRPFLAVVDVGACRVGSVDVAWSMRRVSADADEIGIRLAGAQIEVELRHSFSTGWTTRLLIVNRGSTARVVERLQLIARPAPGQRVSALATGSRLCWATQPADGVGPLLAASLTAGAVRRVSEDGFELAPLRLAAGQRYVAQLRWEQFATPRSVLAGPGRDLPVARTAYEVGEPVLLTGDPDVALVVPPGVGVDEVEEEGVEPAVVVGRELLVGAPGHHRVELRSADGDVRLDLGWVLPLTEQLGVWATSVLAGPRTSAGVVAVTQLALAVVLQAALGAGGLDDADAAADGLDRLTARLLDRSPSNPADASASAGGVDPLEVLYLLGEHGRTGEQDVLDQALTREVVLLGEESPPAPGLGMAVLRTVLAGLDAHELVAPIVRRAVARAAPVAEVTHEVPAAELELLLAVRPLLPDDDPARHRLIAGVRGLGAALGAGLPGGLVSPPPVAEHAHLVAVLRLLPEDGVPGVTDSWGASPSLLAHRSTIEVLDRLTSPEPSLGAGAEAGRAAAWLAMAQRHA